MKDILISSALLSCYQIMQFQKESIILHGRDLSGEFSKTKKLKDINIII